MSATSWYARERGIYVSEEQKESIYGRLALEVKRLEQDLGYLRVDLNRIGTNFEVTGRLLKQQTGSITLDKHSVQSDAEQVFGLVDSFNKMSAELAEKKAALDKLG